MCSQSLAQTEPPVALAVHRIDALVPASGRVPGAVASSKGMEWKLHAPPSADAAPRWGAALRIGNATGFTRAARPCQML
jgi:hypothetical protein